MSTSRAARTIDIPGLEGASVGLTGEFVLPAGEGPWPGVVLVHEAFGVNDVMRRQAERFASAGYIALMPDLFTEGGARKCLSQTFRELNSGTGRSFADIESARQLLIARQDCTGEVGVIGFCMGGGFALAAASLGFGVASANYGRLPKEIDRALAGACPIVGSYGGSDSSLKGAAKKLDDSLTRLGIDHDVKEYPDAGHSFLNDAESGPPALRFLMKRILDAGPNPEAATDAWHRIDAFFAEHLATKV
ncbi:dienelactone hydrolase family protein [Glaciihabitans sp. GrIS 2.15]|uniref:dienelactone hydrolase family protein n=1 Tax=Glaciihabitans sp. GrIS 2.15 TaxID=3071710 RepID=UPI002DF83A18|nr:carboxymethylenebutenolidase [Glaciihabitans sp. GrIS 2.15]